MPMETMNSRWLEWGRVRVRFLGPPKPPMRPRRVLSFEAWVRKAGGEQAPRRAAARLGMRKFEEGGDAQVKQPHCHWGRLILASLR